MRNLDRSRRRVLEGVSGALVTTTLAGCTDEPGTDARDDPNETDSDGGSTPDGDLDLREANVVDVTVEGPDESGTYAFDVTLHHDDDGEDGYANWWQVERLDGTRLGRRDLTHSHSQQPFTRSDTVEISDDVACVVVRGHDETHGYGGRAMLVSVDSGATRSVDQGSEPSSFVESDCP